MGHRQPPAGLILHSEVFFTPTLALPLKGGGVIAPSPFQGEGWNGGGMGCQVHQNQVDRLPGQRSANNLVQVIGVEFVSRGTLFFDVHTHFFQMFEDKVDALIYHLGMPQ